METHSSGLLRFQRCEACGAPQSLQRYACVQCGSTRLAWQQAGGRGVVYAVTEVSRAPSDSFRALVPYTLVLVDLDEGPRLMAHAESGVAIGERVQATAFAHDGTQLLKFVPAAKENQ
jgi:uncharacterized protein